MRYTDMTPQQRQECRKLQNQLCTDAVAYKGVKPEKCMACDSPCKYGAELVRVLGVGELDYEPVRVEAADGGLMMSRAQRRIVRAMNKRRR